MKKRYPFLPKKWPCSFLTFLFAVFFSLNLQAQTAPAKLWDKTFGGSNDDELTSIQQTSDKGYILGGTSNSGISGDKTHASKGASDFWVVKLDTSGSKLWDKTYGGSGSDWLYSIQQTSDGGYILGGFSGSGIGGDKSQASYGGSDYWVVKLDANGNKLWDKTFGGTGDDRLYSVKQTSDGGYILGGGSNFSSVHNSNYWVIKLDASGNQTWDKTYSGGVGRFTSLQQTSDGGYILGGYTVSGIKFPGWTSDYWIVKLDAYGNKTWDKYFGGSDDDFLLCLQQTSDGGYILGGASESPVSGDKSQPATTNPIEYADGWVVKLDASGNKIWDKTIGCYEDWISSLQQTSDGDYLLGMTSGCGGKGHSNYKVVKLDASGNIRWTKYFGGYWEDFLTSLYQTSDGGFILGGGSYSDMSTDKSEANRGTAGYTYDYWVVKLAAQAPVLPLDFAVSAITDANSGCLSNQETITITVNNFGTTPQSNIPVSYKINNGIPVNEVVAGPLAPNTSLSYSFTTKANLSTSGIYSIEAKTNLTGDALPANDTFTKIVMNYAVTATPTLTASGSLAIFPGDSVVLTAASSVSNGTFTWFKNGNVIAGVTSQNYTAKSNGSYTVAVNNNGCTSGVSNVVIISTTGVGAEVNALNVSVHPNPSNGLFSITLPERNNYVLTVTDLTGKVIRQFTTKDTNIQLNLSNAAKGVYLLKIAGEDKMAIRKLVVK